MKEKIREEDNVMEKLPIHFSRLAEQIYVGMKFLPLDVQHKSAGGIFNHLRKFLTKKTSQLV